MSTKLKIAGMIGSTLLAVGGLTVLASKPASSTFDLPGLNQVVIQQGQTLDNHEARIVNNENAIADLQKTTGTPAPVQVPVPVVVPQAIPQALAVTPPDPVVTSVVNPTPVLVPPLPPVTEALLNTLFGTIAPAGQMRAEKRAACLNEYQKRGQLNEYGVKLLCLDSNLNNPEQYSNY